MKLNLKESLNGANYTDGKPKQTTKIMKASQKKKERKKIVSFK